MGKYRLLAAAALFSAVVPAFAQDAGNPVTTGSDESSAIGITVSGMVDLKYLYTTGAILDVINGLTVAALPSDVDSTTFWSGRVTIDLDVRLSDKVSALIELENRRIEGGANLNLGGDAAGGTDVVHFEQAYIHVAEFLDPKLSLRIGLQDLRYRDGFFLDVSEAESAWNTGTLAVAATRNTLEAAGARVFWAGGEKWDLDLGYYTIIEAGSPRADEGLLALHGNWEVTEKLKLEGLIALMHNGTSATGFIAGLSPKGAQVWSFGTSLDWAPISGLNIFGDVIWQTGRITDDTSPGFAGAPNANLEIDHSALAVRVGAKYMFDASIHPYFQLEFWRFSGDDVPLADGTNHEFISYENNDQFLIVEDNDFGMDIDANYSAWKATMGASITDNISVMAEIGFFDFTAATVYNSAAAELNSGDNIGTEFDVTATWNYSKSLTFEGTVAALVGSDLLENMSRGGDGSAEMFLASAVLRY